MGAIMMLLMTFACTNGRISGEWAVPREEIFEGEGNGDIPAINNPRFTRATEVDYLVDTNVIIGTKMGTTIRAYPLIIMDWHEAVNDQIDSFPIGITYSALSGSSIGLNRTVSETVLEFRISGLLHNSNTIFKEEETFSDWSQMLRKEIRDDLSERALSTFNVFEINWGKWKNLFPDSEVLNFNTDFNRPYGTYPYGDYQTDATKIFFDLPLDIDSLNNILPSKEKILGVIVDGMVKGYRQQHFAPQGFSLIQDEINGNPIVIIGSDEFDCLIAYSARATDGQIHQFSLLEKRWSGL